MDKLNKDAFSAFVDRGLHQFEYAIRKPLLIFVAARYVTRYLITRKIRPWEVNLSTNASCNLNCRHCFARAFKDSKETDKERKELTTEEIIATIEECIDLGIFSFGFQGGEVLLHPDLERIIKACKPHRSFIYILTNGVLFNDEWAEKLRSWGVDRIAVSIDSMKTGEHDDFRRGKGILESAINAAKTAKKNGLAVLVLTTVTKRNLHSEGIKKIHEFCRENNFVNHLFIGIPVGNWANKTDIMIDEADHAYMEGLSKSSGHKVRRDLTPRFFLSGCPAITEGFYLTSYGDVLPCPFIHISMGDIREHSIQDILARASTVDKFRENRPTCLIGQDKAFIEKYGKKTFVAKRSPLDGEEVFEFSELPKRSVPLVGDGTSIRSKEVFFTVNQSNPELSKGFNLHYHSECIVCHTPVPTRPKAFVTEHEYQNTTTLQFPVYRCPKCDLVYLNPRPDVSELKKIYPPEYYSYHLSKEDDESTRIQALVRSLWFKISRTGRKKRILPHLVRPRGRPLRILDVGCGTGAELDNLKSLLPPDTESYGVDIDGDAVTKAEKGGHRVFKGRFEEVDIPEGFFDLVASYHVIEHVERPDLFLRKCIRSLTPQGIALIETPNTEGLDYQLLQKKHWGGYHAPRHWQLFNINTFRVMADKIGAKVVDSGPSNTALFWNWSCHSLCTDMMPRAVADKLFPPVDIFYGGLQPLVILASFSLFERALIKLFNRANCLWVVIGKDGDNSKGVCADEVT